MEKRGKKVKNLTPKDIRSRERKRRKRKIVSLFLLLPACFAFLFVLFVYLVSLPGVSIQRVEIKGAQAISSEEIYSLVLEELSNKFLGIFPNSSFLFVPGKEIEGVLRENFLRVQSVNIKIDGLQTLVVEIEERRPYAIWCHDVRDISSVENGVSQESAEGKSQEECYFVDNTGLIFVRAPLFSPGAFLRFEGDLKVGPDPFPLGRQVLEPNFFAGLLDFVELLSGIDITAEKVHLPIGQEISLEAGGPSRILLSKKQDLELVFKNILAIVNSETFQADIGGDFSNVDYIDMKISDSDKVFYSIKDSN